MDWLSSVRELFGFIFPFLEHVPIIRAILGFILVFSLPGFTWTFIFFRHINVLERITLSFGLSIAIVTLSLILVSWVTGMRITGFNSTLVIVGITALPALAYYLNKLIKRRRGSAA